MTRVILRGCNGRMGQMISGLAASMPDVEIVAGIDIMDKGANVYPVYRALKECGVSADVLIDFSSPKGIRELINVAVVKKLPLVLCATGYDEDEVSMINEASEKIPILRSANMSLGINTAAMLIQEAAKVLAGAGYDMEIVEKHHNQKLDAPSGTALLLADKLNEVMNNEYSYKYDRTGDRMKRPVKEIGISSVRGGSIVGEHEVIFAGMDEVIEIKHTAYSRSVFGKGALEAAKFLAGKVPGMYSMENVVK